MAEGDEKPTKYSPFRAIDRKGYTQLETVVEWKKFFGRVPIQNIEISKSGWRQNDGSLVIEMWYKL